MGLFLVIVVEVKIHISDRLYKVLEAAGKVELISSWALDGIESNLEVYTVSELIENE